tara:strand:- start:9033 stop:9167 length:135 start_codon:yes stop_codon:yes gene_type:complete
MTDLVGLKKIDLRYIGRTEISRYLLFRIFPAQVTTKAIEDIAAC